MRYRWTCGLQTLMLTSIECQLEMKLGVYTHAHTHTHTHTDTTSRYSSSVQGQSGTQVTTGLKPRAHEKNSRNRFKSGVDAKSAICFSPPPTPTHPSSFLSHTSPAFSINVSLHIPPFPLQPHTYYFNSLILPFIICLPHCSSSDDGPRWYRYVDGRGGWGERNRGVGGVR